MQDFKVVTAEPKVATVHPGEDWRPEDEGE